MSCTGTARGTCSCLYKAPVYVISSSSISPLCWHSSTSPVIGTQGGKGWCHKSSFHLAVSHSSEPCLDINPRKLLANFTNKNFQTPSNVYVSHIQERRSLNLGTLMSRWCFSWNRGMWRQRAIIFSLLGRYRKNPRFYECLGYPLGKCSTSRRRHRQHPIYVGAWVPHVLSFLSILGA